MRQNKIHWLLSLTIIFYLSNAFAQSKIPTNQEIISRIFAPPAITLFKDSLNITKPINIKPGDSGSFSRWITQILTDSCLSKNFLVYSVADSSKIPYYSIMVSNALVDIQYHSAGRKWLFFKKGIRRNINGGYRMQVQAADGRLIYSDFISGAYSDVIPSNAITKVENPNLEFTKGTKIGSPFIKRWLEPVIITVATASVVYLFYTLRSEN